MIYYGDNGIAALVVKTERNTNIDVLDISNTGETLHTLIEQYYNIDINDVYTSNSIADFLFSEIEDEKTFSDLDKILNEEGYEFKGGE